MRTLARRLSDQSGGASWLRRLQTGLVRFLQRDVRAAMPRLDPARPESADPWISDLSAVVGRFARMSAEVAARAYEAERAAAQVRGRFTPRLADPPPEEQIQVSFRWAAHGVWTPPAPPENLRATERPAYSAQIAAGLMEEAFRRAEAAATKLTFDTGRRTVVDAVEEDPDAVGWYRSARPNACPFCRLMASRGAVYVSRGTAGADANDRFVGEGRFKYHDHCYCVAMPVLRGDRFELSPRAAEWDDIYRRYAQGHPGDQLRRFRIAIRVLDEGRSPTDQDFAA